MVSDTCHQKDWLLIADGEPLSEKKLHTLSQNKKVMVLDGAYDYVKKIGLKIDVLLGDFDAISSSSLKEARETLTVVDAPNQNKTDLGKGIEYLDSCHAKSIHIAAATGRRLQHTLYNLRLLKKFYSPARPLCIFSEKEIISYYENTEITLSGHIGDSIALLGFPKGIMTTSGLKYDVTNYVMEFEKQSSISNAFTKKEVSLKVDGGILVIHELTV